MSKVTVKKIEEGKWVATVEGNAVAEIGRSNKYGGSYAAKLANGKTIYAGNQEGLKRLIEENL